MIAAAITTAVLGATVTLATQLQQTYSTELDDATVGQEGRFALDWIARVLRSAGSNPYSITISPCPDANTAFQAIRLDPNGNGLEDDVRVQADINPPNGLLVGSAADCTEELEDIEIAHDPDTLVITKQDRAVDAEPVTMTEPIFTALLFAYLDAAGAETAVVGSIASVQIQVTGQSKARNPITGQSTNFSLATEVRLRGR
jgi:Tfp pilus assembly protein PilW